MELIVNIDVEGNFQGNVLLLVVSSTALHWDRYAKTTFQQEHGLASSRVVDVQLLKFGSIIYHFFVELGLCLLFVLIGDMVKDDDIFERVKTK